MSTIEGVPRSSQHFVRSFIRRSVPLTNGEGGAPTLPPTGTTGATRSTGNWRATDLPVHVSTRQGEYDPGFWTQQILDLIEHFRGQRTPEAMASQDQQMAVLRARQLSTARAAFPWAEVWWDDSERTLFTQEARDRMSDDQARQIRFHLVGSP